MAWVRWKRFQLSCMGNPDKSCSSFFGCLMAPLSHSTSIPLPFPFQDRSFLCRSPAYPCEVVEVGPLMRGPTTVVLLAFVAARATCADTGAGGWSAGFLRIERWGQPNDRGVLPGMPQPRRHVCA